MKLHLTKAYNERLDFKTNIIRTRQNENIDNAVQLTIDFAEKILIPTFVDQPKKLYFITGLKIDLFGIANNTLGTQKNFVLTEGHWPADKSINSIGSMLLYYINSFHQNKQYIDIMADNCGGQNKNRFMMQFLSYLCIISDSIKEIHLRFLIAGHTKNFADSCFGMCKRSLKHENVLDPADVVKCYSNSAKCNEVVTTDKVKWYNFKEFLDQFYEGAIKDISIHHHFYINKEKPGIITYKQLIDSEHMVTANILRKGVTINDIKNPTGNFKTLDKYVVPSETYSLTMDESEPNKTVTAANKERKAYLDKNIVDEYFTNAYAEYKQSYFHNGSNQL